MCIVRIVPSPSERPSNLLCTEHLTSTMHLCIHTDIITCTAKIGFVFLTHLSLQVQSRDNVEQEQAEAGGSNSKTVKTNSKEQSGPKENCSPMDKSGLKEKSSPRGKTDPKDQPCLKKESSPKKKSSPTVKSRPTVKSSLREKSDQKEMSGSKDKSCPAEKSGSVGNPSPANIVGSTEESSSREKSSPQGKSGSLDDEKEKEAEDERQGSAKAEMAVSSGLTDNMIESKSSGEKLFADLGGKCLSQNEEQATSEMAPHHDPAADESTSTLDHDALREPEKLEDLNDSMESETESSKELPLDPLTGLPEGWHRTKHERPNGQYYFQLKPVDWKILRSQVEVNSFLKQRGIKTAISLNGLPTKQSPKKKIILKKRTLPSSSEEIEETTSERNAANANKGKSVEEEKQELRSLVEERDKIYEKAPAERTLAEITRLYTLIKKIRALSKKFPEIKVNKRKPRKNSHEKVANKKIKLVLKPFQDISTGSQEGEKGKTDFQSLECNTPSQESLSKHLASQNDNNEGTRTSASVTSRQEQDERKIRRKKKKKKVPLTPSEVIEEDEVPGSGSKASTSGEKARK